MRCGCRLKDMFRMFLGAACLLFLMFTLRGVEAQDKVVFLDVGQGDAILLQDGTYQVLVDGGKGQVVLERLAEEMPEADRKIEVLVLTHPQQDHMEGLLHVLERYQVGLVLLPEVSHTTILQEAWLDALLKSGADFRFAWSGQQLQVGDLELEVLAPFDSQEARAATASDLNNASIVLRATMHGMSVLLTGDAEVRAERLLVEHVPREKLDVDVLKSGHHGSASSSSLSLLEAATPASYVVSVGEDNRYGHPNEEVLARVSPVPVLRTDIHGSVRYVYNGTSWFQSTSR